MMTNEIKRLMRNLDEACTEQGITIDYALSWFNTLKKIQPVPVPEKKTFRDIAKELVNASSLKNDVQRDICIEILCLAHEAGENLLTTQEIVDHIYEKNLVPEKDFGRTIAKSFIYEFLSDYYRKQGVSNPRSIIGKEHWRSLCFALRNFIKTLN